MSSTMISSYSDFSENLHKDFWESAIIRTTMDYSVLKSGFDKIDMSVSQKVIAANLTSRPALTRRHSSSMFCSASTNNAPLTGYNENALLASHASLETVNEEKFRSRAFSEGSSVLSQESMQDQQQSATSRYKTELCRPFEENGKCKYGDKCQFAHGKHELRRMVRHPKYKTELCRTYHTSGFCPYGPRCHFIHNQEDVGIAKKQTQPTRIQSQTSVPVKINNRQLSQHQRPRDLQLFTQSASFGHMPPYSPSNSSPSIHNTQPMFGLSEVLSPISPMPQNSTGGQFFSYCGKGSNSPVESNRRSSFSDNRQSTPPITQLDIFNRSQQPTEFPTIDTSDDLVFDTPPTPPDSDRESATGSPKNYEQMGQRLPIFRCLSKTE
uniref:C3H1-type domain-containing protein n=1 Tax=Ciona intestinalis TaxID=7719 RepID=F6YB59_CIOIN